MTNITKPAKRQDKRAVRTCLMCQKHFDSEGPHNRRCPQCSFNLSRHPHVETVPMGILRRARAR